MSFIDVPIKVIVVKYVYLLHLYIFHCIACLILSFSCMLLLLYNWSPLACGTRFCKILKFLKQNINFKSLILKPVGRLNLDLKLFKCKTIMIFL